jgi:hypothetical protein
VDSSRCFLRATSALRQFGIPSMDIQVNGPYTRIEPVTAVPLLELAPPYGGIQTPNPSAAESTAGPGVTLNRYGKGLALYFSPDIFEAYFRYDTPVLRKLILWALGRVHPLEKRTILVEDAPITVEMFYNERQGEKFVHLINYSGDKRDTGTPHVQDFTTVHGIRVKVRMQKKPAGLTMVPEGKRIEFTYSDGMVTFNAQPLKIHDIYQIS